MRKSSIIAIGTASVGCLILIGIFRSISEKQDSSKEVILKYKNNDRLFYMNGLINQPILSVYYYPKYKIYKITYLNIDRDENGLECFYKFEKITKDIDCLRNNENGITFKEFKEIISYSPIERYNNYVQDFVKEENIRVEE